MTASKPNDIINLVEHTMDTWIKQLESDGLGSAIQRNPGRSQLQNGVSKAGSTEPVAVVKQIDPVASLDDVGVGDHV